MSQWVCSRPLCSFVTYTLSDTSSHPRGHAVLQRWTAGTDPARFHSSYLFSAEFGKFEICGRTEGGSHCAVGIWGQTQLSLKIVCAQLLRVCEWQEEATWFYCGTEWDSDQNQVGSGKPLSLSIFRILNFSIFLIDCTADSELLYAGLAKLHCLLRHNSHLIQNHNNNNAHN